MNSPLPGAVHGGRDLTATTLGELLRYYRLRAVLTQGELAERTGVSLRTIRDLERGRVQSPRPHTVDLLAAGLGLPEQDTRSLFGSLYPAGEQVRPRLGWPAAGCLLPPAAPDLTGRDSELAWLARQADEAATSASLGIVVVHGPPGMGKTSLAVRAGHYLGDRFPDGCLFVDMHGLQPEPLDPLQAVGRLLRAFGAEDIPEDGDQRISLYRSIMARRTVLVIADNLSDEAQIRPLLAASPGSMVLLTSRNAMVGLAASARLELKLLSAGAAVGLLGAIIGTKRAAAEPADVARVARLCAGVPLALRIAGHRLVTRPAWPVSRLADRLADERFRLSVLTAGDIQVQACFDASYRLLDSTSAVLFRRLSLVPGTDTGVGLAAVVAGLPEPVVEAALEHLVDVSLLAASESAGRYVFHDLLKVFATMRLEQEEAGEATVRARQRAHDWLLATAVAAARHFDPENRPSEADLAAFPDRERAGSWLSSELQNWLAAFRAAVAQRRHARVLDVAAAVHWYADHRGGLDLWQEMHKAGGLATMVDLIGDRIERTGPGPQPGLPELHSRIG